MLLNSSTKTLISGGWPLPQTCGCRPAQPLQKDQTAVRILKKTISVLAILNASLAAVFRWLSWTFLALMTLFIVTQVFCRYVLNNSLFWPEDVSLMMMIWVAFAVAPIAYRSGANVALDSFAQLFRGRASYLLYLLIHLLILIMLIFLLIEAINLIGRTKIRANSIPLSMKYIYLIMPVGFGAMIMVGLEVGRRCLVGLLRPQDPAARLPAPGPEPLQQV
jgi:TRAP-type C4-dicarboxylate transport system permease small subunit